MLAIPIDFPVVFQGFFLSYPKGFPYWTYNVLGIVPELATYFSQTIRLFFLMAWRGIARLSHIFKVCMSEPRVKKIILAKSANLALMSKFVIGIVYNKY